MEYTSIKDLPIGTKFKIIDFDKLGEGLQVKIESQVDPEGILEVISNQPFHGPVILKAKSSKFVIGYGMAKQIRVEEYENGNKNGEEK